MTTTNNKDELTLLDIIDNWYHKQTRHHLVDVDPEVSNNLIKPLVGRFRSVEQIEAAINSTAENWGNGLPLCDPERIRQALKLEEK